MSRTDLIHFPVRTRYPLQPLLERDVCVDLWARLRKRFDHGVMACILMPNHLHLDLEGWFPEQARQLIGLELNAFSRSHFPGQRIWDPVPPPQILPDLLHLKRHIRYVHLNPCRAGLAQDPLEWEWSTHRDCVGATQNPWIDLQRLVALFGVPERDFAMEFHSYVSSDPSVKVAGTRLPPRADLSGLVTRLELVGEAVLQATRLPANALKKRGSPARLLAAQMVWQLGGRNQRALAEWLGMKERSLRDLLAAPLSPQKLAPALWILANLERFKCAATENRRLAGESRFEATPIHRKAVVAPKDTATPPTN